jgi:hypothetical protein
VPSGEGAAAASGNIRLRKIKLDGPDPENEAFSGSAPRELRANCGREQMQQIARSKPDLLDHLVGDGENGRRNFQAKSLTVFRLMTNSNFVRCLTGRVTASTMGQKGRSWMEKCVFLVAYRARPRTDLSVDSRGLLAAGICKARLMGGSA